MVSQTKKNVDPYAHYIDDYYGGLRIGSSSNIIFSNGLLDPWSSAGVYSVLSDATFATFNGTTVQNITSDGSIKSVILDLGAHHLDLMFSSPHDPPCANEARRIEDEHIGSWIDQWKSSKILHD